MVKVKKKLFMNPSKNPWESQAVLNPTAIKDSKGVEHLFYRAVDEKGVSTIGYAQVINGKLKRFNKPVLFPDRNEDKKGLEDPRVTKIGRTYYILYTAYDGKNAMVAYAKSNDLKKWKKMGIISPKISVKEARQLVKIKKYRDKWKIQEESNSGVSLLDKDAVLFPKKINGKFVMLHRFLPDIQIVKFKDFSELKKQRFWRKYITNLGDYDDKISLYRTYDWEGEHIGAGAVPIRTKYGWLLIYHGVEWIEQRKLYILMHKFSSRISGIFGRPRSKRDPLIYHAGAALVDLKKPETEISRLKNPLFSPKYEWETEGDINNVVFPTGAVVEGDKLKIYYGCSDTRIGLAEVSLKELLKEIRES